MGYSIDIRQKARMGKDKATHELNILIQRNADEDYMFTLEVFLKVYQYDAEKKTTTVPMIKGLISLAQLIRFILAQKVLWDVSYVHGCGNHSDEKRENNVCGRFNLLLLQDMGYEWMKMDRSAIFSLAKDKLRWEAGVTAEFLDALISDEFLFKNVGDDITSALGISTKWEYIIIPKDVFNVWLFRLVSIIHVGNVPDFVDYLKKKCELTYQSALSVIAILADTKIWAEKDGNCNSRLDVGNVTEVITNVRLGINPFFSMNRK